LPQNVAKSDFSQVKIKLITGSGQVKETAECAPNGYYFIPVYEPKGNYRLLVQGPPGWAFGKNLMFINLFDLCFY